MPAPRQYQVIARGVTILEHNQQLLNGYFDYFTEYTFFDVVCQIIVN
jgi:hypothetical protein